MAVMGRGLQCAVPVGTVNAHTVSLLSSSPPHAATAAAAFSSQASLSHSWIFAVASEFVCFFSPGSGLLGPYQGWWALAVSLCP